MAAMAPWMWVVGFAALAAVATSSSKPIMITFLVSAAGTPSGAGGGVATAARSRTTYYRVSPRNRLAVAVVYIGLVALLVVGLHSTYHFRGL